MSAPAKKRISRPVQVAVVLVVLVAIAALGYLTLISPKRAAASDAERETAAVEALGMRAIVLDTMMTDHDASARLAGEILALAKDDA